MKHHVTGAYFSPTGGTKRATLCLCSCFEGEEKTYVELGAGAHPDLNLGQDDLLVLALPVYADTIPNVPGLLDCLHGDNTPCVVAATYGNCKVGDALAQMKQLLSERGFRCVGGASVITPHVFAPTLGTDRPNAEDRKVLADFAKKVEEKLDSADWQEAELPGNPKPAMKHMPAIPKMRDWDICMGCGFCASVCPTGAMDPMTLKWNDDKCISCMTCVDRCPNGALGFNSSAVASKLTAVFSEPQAIKTFL